MLFTSHRLLNFDTQRNIHNCTTVHICIIYRAVAVLTSAIHSQQSFLQRRPACNIFNTDNLIVYILQIITPRKHKTLRRYIQGCQIYNSSAHLSRSFGSHQT